MEKKFNAEQVWQRFHTLADLNLFMAVPTVYSKLISTFEAMKPADQAVCAEACKKFRLMVSGSAALPQPTLQRWKAITNHTLLERYGMTEIGMALSNPLHGLRKPGFVGKPLPGVIARIEGDAKEGGELLLRGPTIFREYWNKPEATADTFTADGWFKTGDIAAIDADGDFRLVGRASVDVIKASGYKISALEIERLMLEHPDVAECAVVGVVDPTGVYGEEICMMYASKSGNAIQLDALNSWAKKLMAPYKLPRRLLLVTELPRNAMGKVNKKELRQFFPLASK